MKKTFKVFAVFPILMIFLTASAGAQNHIFEMALDANYFMHRDSNFKDVYGNGSFFPELRAGIRLFKGLQVIGAYGRFKETGTVVATTPGVDYQSEASQQIISAGLEYIFEVSWSWELKISAEYQWIDYEEKVSAQEIQLVNPQEPLEEITQKLFNPSGTAKAYRLGAGLLYNIGANIFFEIVGAYSFGDDEVNGVKFDLGGFQAGIGIGFRL